jgi:hypothetical protein
MPFVAGGLALGGGALSGLGSFFGGKSKAKQEREAANRYMAYITNERKTFLDQPESQAIRKRLGTYTEGKTGYDPDILESMNLGTYEDYGKGLADMKRIGRQNAVSPGGVYTPGRQDRTMRILGENLGTRRAEALRSTKVQNANVALQNQRFAVGALPTYLPGLPQTPTIDPSVFQAASAQGPGLFESLATPIGQSLTAFGGQKWAAMNPAYPPYYPPSSYRTAAIGDQTNPMWSRYPTGWTPGVDPYEDWRRRGGGGGYEAWQ